MLLQHVTDQHIAFIRDDEEQGRGTLHGHFLVWLDGFEEVRDALFDPDKDNCQDAREKLQRVVGRHLRGD